jgi:hypothetical protein
MEEEFVQVKVLTKAGQSTQFTASEMERTSDGYRFISFPERRGFKKMIVIKNDAIATISIEAPDTFFKVFDGQVLQMPEVLREKLAQQTEAPKVPYTDGDPRASRPFVMARPVRTEDGTPASIVRINNVEVPVGAAMLGGAPKV